MSATRIVLFFSIFTAVVCGLHYYVWARLIRDPALPGVWPRALTAVLIGLALSMPLSLSLSGRDQ